MLIINYLGRACFPAELRISSALGEPGRTIANCGRPFEAWRSRTGRLEPADRSARLRQLYRGADPAFAGRGADRLVAFQVRRVRRGADAARPRATAQLDHGA